MDALGKLGVSQVLVFLRHGPGGVWVWVLVSIRSRVIRVLLTFINLSSAHVESFQVGSSKLGNFF